MNNKLAGDNQDTLRNRFATEDHMKRTGLPAVIFLLVCGFGTSVARAEGGSAALLLLENGISSLEAKLKAGASELVTLGGKALTATGVESTLKNCTTLKGSEKDTNSCNDVKFTLAGVKQGKTNCRSETSGGEKDPVETVLMFTDVQLAGEETSSKSLAPLLLVKVLGASEAEEELTINCGVVKNKMKGVLGCLLLPGLENIPTTKEVEVTCKINATTKDPETGTCQTSCEWLKEHPFEANLGAGLEDSWIAMNAKGTFNKDVFLDDCNTGGCAKTEMKFELLPRAEKELKLGTTQQPYSVEVFPQEEGVPAKITCTGTALAGGANIKGTNIPGTAELHLELSGCSAQYRGAACTSAELSLMPWAGELVEAIGPFEGYNAILASPKEKGGFAKVALTGCLGLASASELISGAIPMIMEPSNDQKVEVTLKITQFTTKIKNHAKATETPTLEAFGRHVFMKGESGFQIPEELFWGAQ